MEYNASPGPSDETESVLDKQIAKEQKVSLLIKAENIFWFFAKLIIFGAVLIGTLCLLGTYVLHMVLPTESRWLLDADLEHIRSFALAVISGAVASIMTNHYLNRH